MNKKLIVYLPCYNEELNISDLIDEWVAQKSNLKKIGYSLKVYAVNDCSTDNTKDKINQKVKEYKDKVYLIDHKINKNLCGVLNTSIAHFLENADKEDLMALMDGDNTHNPKYIIDMLNKLIHNNKDCIIASRYCENSGVVGVAKHREFMSDMAKIYYSTILRVPNVKDYTCGYRLYTYKSIYNMVEKFGKNPIKEKSFACMMEFLYRLYLTGTTFDEVGFELRYDNKQGESKMQVLTTMRKSLLTALKLRNLKTSN